MKWQPIETAPENESIIIFATPDWVETGFYVLDEDTGEREWFWTSSMKKLHDNFTVTHWMPLPEPPALQDVKD